jgi:ABC-2 type transport system permease protein
VVAAGVGLMPLAVVALATLLAGAWLIVDHYGITAGTTGKVWGDLLESAGRTVVLTALAGALGGVVALFLRHTAAAIGVVMAYVVLVEGMFAAFVSEWQPWLAKVNVDAWVGHGAEYYVEKCQSMSDGGYSCDTVTKTVSFAHGSVYLAVAAVIIIGGGALVFRRRDVN